MTIAEDTRIHAVSPESIFAAVSAAYAGDDAQHAAPISARATNFLFFICPYLLMVCIGSTHRAKK
jgi:hypothetical protein